MTFMCVICREGLSLCNNFTVSGEVSIPIPIIITTKCGHLYHKECLRRAFEVRKEVDQENGRKVSPTVCPMCNKVVLLENVIQIFPTSTAEDNDNLLSKVTEERNKLISENKSLLEKNKELTALWNQARGSNIEDLVCTEGGLCKGNRIVWVENDPPAIGTVCWIGLINQSLYAGVEFEQDIGNGFPETNGKALFTSKPGHGRLVQVGELILFEDFHTDYSSASLSSNTVSSNSTQIRENEKKSSDFEKCLKETMTIQSKTRREFQIIRNDSKNLTAEQIIAVPSVMEEQLCKVNKLKREILSKDRHIKELRELTRKLFEFQEITDSIKESIDKHALDVESCRNELLECLKILEKTFREALVQSQKVKTFLKAGFQWLTELENRFKLLKDTNSSIDEETEIRTSVLDECFCLTNDIESRVFQVNSVALAVNYFQCTPRSKMSPKDGIEIDSALSRFKMLRKVVLMYIIGLISKQLNRWCSEYSFTLACEFGQRLKARLKEFADEKAKMQSLFDELRGISEKLKLDKDLLPDNYGEKIEKLELKLLKVFRQIVTEKSTDP